MLLPALTQAATLPLSALAPQVREALADFHASNYTSCLNHLEKLRCALRRAALYCAMLCCMPLAMTCCARWPPAGSMQVVAYSSYACMCCLFCLHPRYPSTSAFVVCFSTCRPQLMLDPHLHDHVAPLYQARSAVLAIVCLLACCFVALIHVPCARQGAMAATLADPAVHSFLH